VTRGGRFFHLTGPTDKGRAVLELLRLYPATAAAASRWPWGTPRTTCRCCKRWTGPSSCRVRVGRAMRRSPPPSPARNGPQHLGPADGTRLSSRFCAASACPL
jgi:hypothetical protein